MSWLDGTALAGVRRELRPFAEGAAPTPGVEAFCHQYGLDFRCRHPDLDYRAGAVDSGPYRLAVHYWRQPGAAGTLLLLHGYFDHTGLYGRLIDYGLRRNWNVLVFDLPGHGLSTGERAAIDDFSQYSRAVADVLAACVPAGEVLWAMAQSTGAAALTQFAREYPWPFRHAVLLAPLIRPVEWPLLRIGLRLADGWMKQVPRRFAHSATRGQFVIPPRQDPLQSAHIPLSWPRALCRWVRGLPRSDLGVGPVLILQGRADRTVAWRYNLGHLRRLYPGSRVVLLDGGEHHLANERRALQREMFRAVDDWLAGEGETRADRSDDLPR